MADLVAEAIAGLTKQKSEIEDWLSETDEVWTSQEAKDRAVNHLRQVDCHLAEFDEHKRNQQGYCYAECLEDSGYDSPVQDYPCNFLVTKAKRLLGRETK